MSSVVDNRVCIYGLDEDYRVIHYTFLMCGLLNAKELARQAAVLSDNFPSVCIVYAAERCDDARAACRDSMKTHLMEDRVTFKVLLDQIGKRII